MSVPCYMRGSLMPFDEDTLFEFKAHRQLSDTDLSSISNTLTREGSFMPKVQLKRVSISQTLCGMINTGKGGTLFLGVTDEGRAEGFSMARYQQDHFLLALDDLFERYNPRVPKKLYNVNFVPIIDEFETEFKPDNWIETGNDEDRKMRALPHELRRSRYCWCDSFAMAAQEMGLIHRFYIIEIQFFPWTAEDFWSWTTEASIQCPLQAPLFCDEAGKFYIRNNGHTGRLSQSEVARLEKPNFQLNPENHQYFGVGQVDEQEEYFSYDEKEWIVC